MGRRRRKGTPLYNLISGRWVGGISKNLIDLHRSVTPYLSKALRVLGLHKVGAPLDGQGLLRGGHTPSCELNGPFSDRKVVQLAKLSCLRMRKEEREREERGMGEGREKGRKEGGMEGGRK